MGQFNAGTWLIGLTIYFAVFTMIVLSVLNASIEYGVDYGNTYVNDVGFISGDVTDGNTSMPATVSQSDSITTAGVLDAFTFMFGFNSYIDMPATFYWIIVIFFNYIPLVALIFSAYMALPFIH